MAFTINSMAQSGAGFNSIFGTSNSGNSSSGIYSLLGDYSSIKKGTYGKLLTKYFSEADSDKATKKTSFVDAKKMMSNEAAKPNAAYTALNDTKSLQSSIKALSDESLYEKKTVKGEDGKETSVVDMDKLYDKAKAFVNDYNDLMDSGSSSNVSGIKTNVKSMVSRTDANKSDLKDIGITVNSDNTLSIDKDKFKAADADKVKNLLGQTGGYASMVGVNAQGAEYYAQAAASSGSLYGNTGSYTYGNAFSSFSVSS